MSDLLAWMEEPCSCGDIYSHPDGGDSQCRYCDGAIRMRREFERLTAELDNERARGIHSCGPHCQRVECKLRRENERLRAALEEIAGDNEPKQFMRWAQAVARKALQVDSDD